MVDGRHLRPAKSAGSHMDKLRSRPPCWPAATRMICEACERFRKVAILGRHGTAICCDPRPPWWTAATAGLIVAGPNSYMLRSSAAMVDGRHVHRFLVFAFGEPVAILRRHGGRPPPGRPTGTPGWASCCDPRPPWWTAATLGGQERRLGRVPGAILGRHGGRPPHRLFVFAVVHPRVAILGRHGGRPPRMGLSCWPST